jgi:hypothetical protein
MLFLSLLFVWFPYWQTHVEDVRKILTDKDWKVKTTVFWGQRDRWLSYDGVEDFCKDSNHKLVELPLVQNALCFACAWTRKLNLPFLSPLKQNQIRPKRNKTK